MGGEVVWCVCVWWCVSHVQLTCVVCGGGPGALSNAFPASRAALGGRQGMWLLPLSTVLSIN